VWFSYDKAWRHKVVSVESSLGQLAGTAARVAQLGNGLDPAAFEIIQCYTEQLKLDILGGAPADIVCCEPYYEILEGWHLQEALNYYYTIRFLRSRGLISVHSIVTPASCRIMGCIIESRQLRSAYKACGRGEEDSLCGFKHSFINQLGGNFHKFDLSFPIWQYDFKEMTKPVELGALTYTDPSAPLSCRTCV